MRTVCVLGGSLSGLECARNLAAAGFQVHVFRTLHDPSRSFRDLHPIYEYCPRSLSAVAESQGKLLADAIETWSAAGLAEDDNTCIGTLLPDGKFLPSPPRRRVHSKVGGFLGLLESIASQLPGNARDRKEVLARVVRTDSNKWEAVDLQGGILGSYSTLICSYDYFMRGTRKAAVRALLEDCLPISAPVMRAVAGATDGCVFALIVATEGVHDEIPFDVVHVKGVPELALIIRNGGAGQMDCGQQRRGLPDGVSWTLVATSDWTDSVRPNATCRWNKDAVARQMLAAFSKIAGTHAHALRPPYHWGGYASLTFCTAKPFAFDATVDLGFVGDFFAGHGAEEALLSGAALGAHLGHIASQELSEQQSFSVLPEPSDWESRVAREHNEETSILFGRPAATDDHSWPTLRQLVSGTLPRGQRCMDRYRSRRIWEKDLTWLRSQRQMPAVPEYASRGGRGAQGRGGNLRGGAGYSPRSSSGLYDTNVMGSGEHTSPKAGIVDAEEHANVGSHRRGGVRRRWNSGGQT